MQQRMLDAVAAIPGVTAVGYRRHLPLGLGGGDPYVFTDATTDFRPTNQVADAMNYNISPGYIRGRHAAARGQRLHRTTTKRRRRSRWSIASLQSRFSVGPRKRSAATSSSGAASALKWSAWWKTESTAR